MEKGGLETTEWRKEDCNNRMKKGRLKQQNGERKTQTTELRKEDWKQQNGERKIVIKKKDRKVKNKMSNFLIKSEIQKKVE